MTTRHRMRAAIIASAGGVLAAVAPATAISAQAPGAPTGVIRGIVTATTTAGGIVPASNVPVTLWATDTTTEAVRGVACAAWLADKTTWLQARQEIASPSGIDWAGTKMAKDLTILTQLMALRRDTTRANQNGEFSFASVPTGAYTIEAEAFAANKFLQWSRDIAVIHSVTTGVTLDGSVIAENQYCETSSPGGKTPTQ